jgi:cytochrome c-type biogenesis protein CcmE
VSVKRKKMRNKIILGSAILLMAAAAVSMLSIDDSLVVFFTPQEAVLKIDEVKDRKIRIGAMVKEGTVIWDAETLKLQFTLTDLRKTSIAVTHHGQPPDMFKEGSGVVVEGRLVDGGRSFISHKLIVKHSEEYKAPEDHALLDPEDFRKELLKNENFSQ